MHLSGLPPRTSTTALATLLLVTGLLAGAVAPAGATPGNAGRPHHRTGQITRHHGDQPRHRTHPRLLERARHGRAAVRALAEDLPTAAQRSGVSTSDLRTTLTEDPTAWVAPTGRLFYRDVAADSGTVPGTPRVAAATYPSSDTFRLHSDPTAPLKIFLDFDGADVSGTAWNQPDTGANTSTGGMPDGHYTGFSIDGDPSWFTAREDAAVQETWREVSEVYAPFRVDVTTQDPGNDGLLRSSAGDTSYGQRVLVSSDPTANQEMCSGCTGVAWLGTYGEVDPDGYYGTAWVFTSQLGNDPMLTAQTVAHEVGHTFSLHHDGTATSDYAPGHANWHPIMGYTIDRPISQFSTGEYAGANNHEDDLALIAARAPLRSDDVGERIDTARPLAEGTTYAGLIGTRGDTDVFAIDHPCSDPLTATARGIGAGTTLDLRLRLLRASGAVLASANPASGMDTSMSPPVATGMDARLTDASPSSGHYYLAVDGVGHGDPARDGYSDYDSLGQYTLRVTGCTSTSGYGAARPGAPRGVTAAAGRPGRPVTASASWHAPRTNGGARVTGYRVEALRIGRHGAVVSHHVTGWFGPRTRHAHLRLRSGHYRFRVRARNAVGASHWSVTSRAVRAR